MRAASSRARARWGTTIGVVAVLLISPAAASAAVASTGTGPGSDRAAAVQAVLDRVLGPGNATVIVSDTIRTSTASTTSLQWGSGVVASGSSSSVTVAGTSASASTRQNAVSGTATDVVTPAGALVRQNVAVVVDRAHLGGVSVASLRTVVRAAAGIVRARGDRLTVVVTRFARPVPATVPVPAPALLLMPYITPAIGVLAAVVAALILAFVLRGPRRPGKGLGST